MPQQAPEESGFIFFAPVHIEACSCGDSQESSRKHADAIGQHLNGVTIPQHVRRQLYSTLETPRGVPFSFSQRRWSSDQNVMRLFEHSPRQPRRRVGSAPATQYLNSSERRLLGLSPRSPRPQAAVASPRYTSRRATADALHCGTRSSECDAGLISATQIVITAWGEAVAAAGAIAAPTTLNPPRLSRPSVRVESRPSARRAALSPSASAASGGGGERARRVYATMCNRHSETSREEMDIEERERYLLTGIRPHRCHPSGRQCGRRRDTEGGRQLTQAHSALCASLEARDQAPP